MGRTGRETARRRKGAVNRVVVDVVRLLFLQW